jgi:hypothetical protein
MRIVRCTGYEVVVELGPTDWWEGHGRADMHGSGVEISSVQPQADEQHKVWAQELLDDHRIALWHVGPGSEQLAFDDWRNIMLTYKPGGPLTVQWVRHAVGGHWLHPDAVETVTRLLCVGRSTDEVAHILSLLGWPPLPHGGMTQDYGNVIRRDGA